MQLFRANIRGTKECQGMDGTKCQYQRRKTKPRYSIENLRKKKLPAKVIKNYKPFAVYLLYVVFDKNTLQCLKEKKNKIVSDYFDLII